MAGEIQNGPLLSLIGQPQTYASPGNQTLAAWAADLTYTRGDFKTFVEGLQEFGELSPANYVSGGPSNRISDILVGFNWKQGPITYRTTYSMGFYDNPSGTQYLLVPGITAALTRNAELYVDYALQEVRRGGSSDFSPLENGLQLVLHWHF